MAILAFLASFLPAGLVRLAGAAAEAAATIVGEMTKTRAGWAVIGCALGFAAATLHVNGKWAADIEARTVRAAAAQTIEAQRQANVMAITIEAARLRAEALAAAERALDDKVKETPHEAAGDDRPGLSADRVRRVFSVR